MDTGSGQFFQNRLVNEILRNFQALLEVHDEIAAHIQNSLEEVKYIDGVSSNEDSEEEEGEREAEEKEEKSEENGEEIVDTFRVIGLRRKPGESLVIKLYSTFTAL